MRVFPCGICVGVMRLGDGLTCPHWIILMMKTKGNKRQCEWFLVCDVLIIKNGLKILLNYCWCCCELCSVVKMAISSLFVWTCHLHYFNTWFWEVLCALRKNDDLMWMYQFEGSIARRDGYYYGGSCHAPRQMHGQICPPWVPDWETAGVYH